MRALRALPWAKIPSAKWHVYLFTEPYPDLEYLFPIQNLPEGHRYMSPVSWSPEIPQPDWWNRLPLDRPVVYANLGSSGRSGVLQKVMDALAALPVTVIAATAGRQPDLVPSPNAFIADYLPGKTSAARSDLVITNGGNMSAYQALGEGKPPQTITRKEQDNTRPIFAHRP